MKILITGSFDPPTLGHIDIIERALKLSDDVTVCVMVNDNKKAMYDLSDRLEMLRRTLADKVKTDSYDGWCYEYCINNKVDTIVRGFRNAADYAYETEMATFNKERCGVDTLLLLADAKYRQISSSTVKELIDGNRDVDDYLPAEVTEFIRRKKDNA